MNRLLRRRARSRGIRNDSTCDPTLRRPSVGSSGDSLIQSTHCARRVNRPLRRSIITPIVVAIGLVIAFGGCAGMQYGAGSLYRNDIRTVYVPVIYSDVFRRDFGERMTEALIKEIELKTPYKVVHTPDADSVLTGRIINESKTVIAENAFDEPRLLETGIAVHVTWMDRYGNVLMPDARIPVSPFALEVNETSQFIPEAGQSHATSQLVIFRELAQQIVGQMEIRW